MTIREAIARVFDVQAKEDNAPTSVGALYRDGQDWELVLRDDVSLQPQDVVYANGRVYMLVDVSAIFSSREACAHWEQ